MTTTFAPQFDTATLDLVLKKGESAQFSVAVTDFDLDLRNCLIFAEIRRTVPGYDLISIFTGIIVSGSNTIQIKRYPVTDDKAQLLKSLPVRVGDLIALEGSGITGLKVLAVTDSQIIVSGTASRTVNEARLLVRSLSLASFTAIPYLPVINVLLTGTASSGATSMNVANVSRTVPAGTTLVFNDGGTAYLAVLAVSLIAGDTIAYVSALAATINSGSSATVGAKTVITSASAAISATSISVTGLSVSMPSGTRLNFATRTEDGWTYIGSATLSSSALVGATTLAVSALGVAIPANAIAWFGSHTFNSFILAIDPADTQFLESGDYGYDVICRQSDGYTIRLIQGNVKLTDHWSDGV
jgi:hypothetical protein